MDAYDQIGWTREGLVPAVELKILDPQKVGHTIHINVFALDRLAQVHADTPRFAKKILEIILEAASRSGIPGSLYFRSQRNLADQINGLLESMEIVA